MTVKDRLSEEAAQKAYHLEQPLQNDDNPKFYSPFEDPIEYHESIARGQSAH